MKFRCLVAVLAFLMTGGAFAAEPVWIFGMHDPGGESYAVDKGKRLWITFTVEIGHDPNNYSGGDYRTWSNAGHGVIVRLNNGYGSTGTLPYQSEYQNFATRCANFVAATQGADIFIIGNETNGLREWPGNNDSDPTVGEAITVSRYIDCYNRCYTAIKNVRSSAQVCPSPAGTWGPPYPQVGIEGFLDYWVNLINGIGASKVDALMLHCYTHGCDPSLVTNEAKMGPPYEDIYYNFRVYRNYMWAIRDRCPGFSSKPVYITECDECTQCGGGGGYTWSNVNSGWVKNIYSEINNWNNMSGNQKIRSVCLFRWYDVMEGIWNFGISPRGSVITDWSEAMNNDYRWTTQSMGTFAGYVKNSSNQALVGANVTTSPGSYSAQTNGSGYYQIDNVPVGTYDVIASMAGYNSQTQTSKSITANTTTTVNFTLTTASGSNLALTAPIYLECGHYNSTVRGKYLFDGNLSTKWCCAHNGLSTAGDHWIAFDLGSSATVSQFVVKHASMGGEPTYYNTKTFYIESASSIMGPWTQEFYVDNTSQVTSNTLTYGTPKALRFVRLLVTKPNPSIDWAVRIPEFEVWGTSGTAQPIKIEAENYDNFYQAVDGAEFHDTDSTNSGGQYRTQGVDIETCAEGTYNIGWIAAGEWLMYPFYATSTSYQLSIRHAGTSTATCRLFVDGVDKTGAISLPSTGGYQTWATKDAGTISITAGWHDVKFQIDSAGFNLNYFTLALGGGPDTTPPSISSITPSSTCVKTNGTINVTATVTDSGGISSNGIYLLNSTNLLTNPSFESGGGSFTGWTNTSSNNYSINNTYPNPTTAKDGAKWAGSSCAWSSGVKTPELRQAVTVTPGAKYFLSVWTHTDGSPNTCSSYLQWKDGAATGDGQCTTIASSTSNTPWKQLCGVVTPTSSTLTICLRLSWDCASSGGGGNFDMAAVRLATNPSTYASGTATWNGVTVTGPYNYQVYAVDNASNWAIASASSAVVIDDSGPNAPGTPTDAGAYSAGTSLTFNWTAASDVGCAGVASYYCQIGTSPGASNTFTGNVGSNLSKMVSGCSHGSAYYCRVYALDALGNIGAWSGNSDGITVVANADLSVNAAKALADSTSVGLSGRKVTAIYASSFYVEDPDRLSGIKVVPVQMPSGLALGDTVDVGGVLQKTNGERYIANATVKKL